jgi:protein-S-isoprenylcysteine O-methyltransferase Ste14
MAVSSPWWYQRRSAVFALIYLVGFTGGWLATGAHRYEPAFAGYPWLLGLAVFFTAACLAVRAWGSSYLTAATVWNANAKTDSLIIAGPFRYTRHPLYLGNALLALGFGLLAPLPGAAFIVIANAAFIGALIRHEEVLMERRYGDAFRTYRTQVPQLFPRLWPAPADASLRPSLAQGILSEIFTAAVAAGLFAWILVPHIGMYLFVALYALGVFAQQKIDQRV